MRAVLGIGNPGNRYKDNRHNAGFMLVDYFAAIHSLSFSPSKSDFYLSESEIDGSKYILIKPTTYVNNSGIVALFIVDNYKIDPQDLLVIHDDINIETAKIKIKISGGDGGHNGVNSIIYHLASDNFPRLRIGIGGNFEKGEMANYVLSDFGIEEKLQLDKSFKSANHLIEQFVIGGVKQLLDANSKLIGMNENLSNFNE
ncbi:MAG: aminoacyl-tRNA hydrolase [Bacteroidetes bacterium]|nr:aminoacyl-tRNA hydrolase [Bacteroidota bacterium]